MTHDVRADGVQQAQIPLLQGLLHDRVVRIGKGPLRDAEGGFKIHAPQAQQPDQLRNRHHGMRVVQLGRDLLREEGIIAAVPLLIFPQQILHGGGDQHILLLDAQLLSRPHGVVGIQELDDVLRPVLVRGGLGILLIVEQGEIHLVQALRLPEAQGSDVLHPVADDGHVIGHGQHVPGLHPDDHGLLRPADGPGIAPAGPVVRLLGLPAADKGLLEQAVFEPQAVAGQRHIAGHRAVQEAGGQPAEAAVAEGVVLDVLQNRRIRALFRKQALRVLQQAHAVQIVVDQPAHQILHGQIEGLALREALRLLLRPDRGQGFHGRGGKRVVQLRRGGFRQGLVGLGQQQGFRGLNQLFSVHPFLLLLSRVPPTVFRRSAPGILLVQPAEPLGRPRGSAPGFIRQSQLPPTVPGRFIRASPPSPRTSCIGKTAVSARVLSRLA